MEKHPETCGNDESKIEPSTKTNITSLTYRGFATIGQEMERDIALLYFQSGDKKSAGTKKTLFFRGWR